MIRSVLRQKALWTTAALTLWAATAQAQSPITVSVDSVFYGDNVEYFGPFRTGETILGSWQRIQADFKISDLATVRLGLYALEKNGGDRAELARPVASLIMGTDRHRFIIGTIESGNRPQGMGPDRTTPHGVLPLLAAEQQWFTRAYEAGLQWIENTNHFSQDVWFDYQKVITPEHRELFDGGIVGRVQASPTSPVALVYQFQVVHHGGQQFDVGPVSDSFGYGPGLLLRHEFPGVGKGSLETYAMFSYDRPDRENPALTVKGNGVFARLAFEKDDWRAHALIWKGHSFKHEGGDANYLSVNPDGTAFTGTVDYGEAGLAKVFRPAKTVEFEASGRAHYTENRWGYSYRLMGIVHFEVWKH